MSQPVIESKDFWEKQLEQLKASGLSRAEYCRTNGVNYDRFGYWLTRLRSAPSKFLPIKIREQCSGNPLVGLCTLEIRGHTLKIHDVSALSFILEKLIK